jgi:hypothetical protein
MVADVSIAEQDFACPDKLERNDRRSMKAWPCRRIGIHGTLVRTTKTNSYCHFATQNVTASTPFANPIYPTLTTMMCFAKVGRYREKWDLRCTDLVGQPAV